MIRVKRGDAPEVFTRKNSAAIKERERAVEYYSQEPFPAEGFKFTWYSSSKDKYKDILIKMFNSRCAYCETMMLVVSRGDIEHFRPKLKYKRKDGTDCDHGYYWLASDWDNLYLSCTNCNQNTTFDIIDTDDPTRIIRQTAGKMNQFALSDERFRRDLHTLVVEEEEPYRLLIDPCKDDPESLLEFLDNGILRPRMKTGLAYEKARYSIDVYVLQRDVLVKARREKYLAMMGKIQAVDKLLGYVSTDMGAAVRSNRFVDDKQQLDKEFMGLLDMLDIEKFNNEYIALARQYIYPFLNDYITRLSGFLHGAQGKAWYGEAITYFQPQMAALKVYMDKMSLTSFRNASTSS